MRRASLVDLAPLMAVRAAVASSVRAVKRPLPSRPAYAPVPLRTVQPPRAMCRSLSSGPVLPRSASVIVPRDPASVSVAWKSAVLSRRGTNDVTLARAAPASSTAQQTANVPAASVALVKSTRTPNTSRSPSPARCSRPAAAVDTAAHATASAQMIVILFFGISASPSW
jgi:hypothetical protein